MTDQEILQRLTPEQYNFYLDIFNSYLSNDYVYWPEEDDRVVIAYNTYWKKTCQYTLLTTIC